MTPRSIAYLALCVRDVEAVTRAFTTAFGLPWRTARTPEGRLVPVTAFGATATALFAPDDPFLGPGALTGVHHLALSAADPLAAVHAAGLAAVCDAGDGGLDGGRQAVLDPAMTCGIRLRFATPLELPEGVASSARFDHIGVVARDLRPMAELFERRLRLPLVATQNDREGAGRLAPPGAGPEFDYRRPGGARCAFHAVGDTEIEITEDADDVPRAGAVRHGAPGDVRQDRSTIGRFIDRRGEGLHHIALATSDIAASLATCAAAGLELIDTAPREGANGSLIGFVHPRALGGVTLHFVQRPSPG